MSKIRYEFCDGKINEIEVSDELFALHEQLVKEEKRNHKKETRRHVSLNYLNDLGVDFEDVKSNPLNSLIQQEDSRALEKIFSFLTDEQREMLELIYIDKKTMAEIAREQNLAHSTIKTKVYRIIEKIKKLL